MNADKTVEVTSHEDMTFRKATSRFPSYALRSSRRTCNQTPLQLHRIRCFSSSLTDDEYDVTIIGGGAVGSVLAKLLSRNVPSLKISLVDARTPKPFQQVIEHEKAPSPRAYALSPKSISLLGDSVLKQLEENDRVAYYDSMQVWESDGPAMLHFSHEDLHDGAPSQTSGTETNILGAVVEDSPMVSAIWNELREEGAVDLNSPASIKRIIPPKNDDEKVEIVFDGDGTERKTSTNLLIAADGGNSFVRRSLGTFPTVSFGYGRHAVTCTVAVDGSLNQVAFQRFQPNGPIALLPVWDGTKDGETIYANIVWSTTPEEAKILTQLPENEFVQRMNDLLQSGPTTSPPIVSEGFKEAVPRPLKDALNGVEMISNSINSGLSMSGMVERRKGFRVPPLITDVVGRRFSFELNLMHARNYVRPRVALVGDGKFHTVFQLFISVD